MPPCPHWRSLGTIKQVESRRNGVNTEQWTLPFRPNTTCSWRLVRTRPDGSRVVCVAVEGDSHDLRAEIWIQQPKQGRIDQRFPIKLNEEFAFHPPASWRNIKCSVSIRRCSECEDEKAIRALAAVHAEAEEPTAEWAERREDAHEIPQELPLDEQHKAADNERATAAALENAQLAATIARLQSELEEREGEANAAIEREKALMEQRLLLKRQVDGLKSSLSDEQTRAASIQRELQRQVDELKSTLVSEQTRSSSLQEQLRNKVEELEKKARELEAAAIEREAQLTAVRQENETLLRKISEQERNNEQQEEKGRPPANFTHLWERGLNGCRPDFRLLVQGDEIAAHKNILALKSAFFFELFRSDPHATEHAVEGIEPRVVHRMLYFVYRAQFRGLEKDAAELHAAARRFQIASLIAECTRVLKTSIASEDTDVRSHSTSTGKLERIDVD